MRLPYREVRSLAQQYDGSIRINTKIDQTGFNKGVAGIQKSVNGLGSSLKSLAGAVGVAFGVAQIVKFGKEAVSLASDLNEVQNVVNTAFGSMSDQVDAWAKNSIKQFGMSELSAKQMASTYMAMSVGSGLQGQGAADMAMKTAERAADISSFYNKSLEESDIMLKSIWTGETESLKQIGVVMTQTNLDAFALANGFGKTTSEMTQSEQIMLRYQYVMNQTRLAAGDFVKTQDSWADQTKILSEQWKQFLSIMGGALIQVLTPALQFLNQFMSVLIGWAQTFAAVVSALFGKKIDTAVNAMSGAASSADSLAGSTAGAAAAQDDLASSTAAANKELQKQTASFDEMNILQSQTSDSGSSGGGSSGGGGGSVGGGISALPTIDSGMYDTAAKGIEKTFSNVWKNIAQGFQDYFVTPIKDNLYKFDEPIANFKLLFQDMGLKFSEWVTPITTWLQTYFPQNVASAVSAFTTHWSNVALVASVVATTVWGAFSPVIDWLVYDGLPMLSEMFDQAAATFEVWSNALTSGALMIWNDAFDPAFTFISKIVTDTFGIIKELWDKYGATTFENIRKAIETTKNTFQNVWDTYISKVFDNIFWTINALWQNHLSPLMSRIGEFVAKLVNGATEIYNGFIAPVANWFISTLYPYIAKAINLIVNNFAGWLSNAADVFNGIMEAAGGLVDFISGVFTGNWKKAWEGVKSIFTGVWNSLVSLIKIPVNTILRIVNAMISAINTAISGINMISFDIPSWVPMLGGKKFGFNIPKISKVPYLAQGAVIPPNQQFMAILGDQKNGNNLEGPESLFRQIVREESGNSGISGPVTFILKVGETTLGRATLKSLQDIARQNGGLELDLR